MVTILLRRLLDLTIFKNCHVYDGLSTVHYTVHPRDTLSMTAIPDGEGSLLRARTFSIDHHLEYRNPSACPFFHLSTTS